MVDIYRFELTGLFIVAILLSLVVPSVLFLPHFFPFFSYLPAMIRGPFYLFGPLAAFLLWIGTVVVAIRVHRWRGLWLLLTAIVMLPGTYVFVVLIWGCLLFGTCL